MLIVLGNGAQAGYITNADQRVDVDWMMHENIEKLKGKNHLFIIAHGDLAVKKRLAEDFKDEQFINYVSETSVTSNFTIGLGNILCPNCTILHNVNIGNHCIIHAGAVIEHDNILEDFVNIGPRVTTAGRVLIKSGARIYTGACIIPGITIGTNAIVGAGAVVIEDVPEGATVVGVPARRIK